MPETIMYHDGNRRLPGSVRQPPHFRRLEEKLTRTAFTADDKAFIESAIYFSSRRLTQKGGRTARSRADRRALCA